MAVAFSSSRAETKRYIFYNKYEQKPAHVVVHSNLAGLQNKEGTVVVSLEAVGDVPCRDTDDGGVSIPLKMLRGMAGIGGDS